MSAYMPPSQSVTWETPKPVFDELDREFHFTTDVCAMPETAKCNHYYTTEFGFSYEMLWSGRTAVDGLKQNWGGVCWCNPPYGARNIAKWLAKAMLEREARQVTTVFLIPNTTDVGWFYEFVYSYKDRSFRPGIECRFWPGRINFVGTESGNVKGSLVVVVRPV